MNTAELLVSCLENEGVRYIFGVPGEENLHFIEALEPSSIHFITTRHEQGAAFMADVYGRLTGRAGVCLATLGPGATNLITGVADANLDGAPLIAITGQVSTHSQHLEAHQYLDLVSMFAPLCKWSTQIVEPETTPEIVRKAFKQAQFEKPGAVHINLPENVAAMPAEGLPLRREPQEGSHASLHSLHQAARLIATATNPIILVGNGAIRAEASEPLIEFATQMRIPVVNTFMGKGLIPYTHPLSLGTVGLQQHDVTQCGLDRADLVIAIGYDLIEYSPKRWNPDGSIPIVHIGATAAEVDRCYLPSVEVVGDIAESLWNLLRRCDRGDRPDPYAIGLRSVLLEDYQAHVNDASFPLKPQRILYDLRAVLDPEDIVISDVGAHKIWVARNYRCLKPNTCLISNGFAAMGIALPGAIAAKLVYPDRKVVAVMGDGGFLMNCQELETAQRLGLPFVMLIFRDDAYGLIAWKQQRYFGHTSHIEFGNPDFVKLAESFGLKGYRVEAATDLQPILQEALSQPLASIIDCPVDYSENLRFSLEQQAQQCPLPPSIVHSQRSQTVAY